MGVGCREGAGWRKQEGVGHGLSPVVRAQGVGVNVDVDVEVGAGFGPRFCRLSK